MPTKKCLANYISSKAACRDEPRKPFRLCEPHRRNIEGKSAPAENGGRVAQRNCRFASWGSLWHHAQISPRSANIPCHTYQE